MALDKILKGVRERVADDEKKISLVELVRASGRARTPHDFAAVFQNPGLNLIAEFKRASPSEGPLYPKIEPWIVAREYLNAGAAALSILTDGLFFDGCLQHLRDVRGVFPDARLLMKDFVLGEYQVHQARVMGADAVLLMVSVLGFEGVRDLSRLAKQLGLTPLVEVHDEAEFEAARKAGATLIGVNNRNLKTLEVSLDVSERLAKLAEPGVTLISESGLKSGQDARRLMGLGYRGFLVGTTFMKTKQPGEAARKFLAEAGA